MDKIHLMLQCTHLTSVEKVTDRQHCRQYTPEGLAGCQLLHGQLQVEERLSNFLFERTQLEGIVEVSYAIVEPSNLSFILVW